MCSFIPHWIITEGDFFFFALKANLNLNYNSMVTSMAGGIALFCSFGRFSFNSEVNTNQRILHFYRKMKKFST